MAPPSTKPRRRSFVPPAPRQTVSCPPLRLAPIHPGPTAPCPPRPTAPCPPRQMEPCPPRPTAHSRPRPTAPPPPRPTSSLVVADLHRKLDVLPPPQIGLHGSVHELLPVLPPRQEPPQYEPPFGTAAAWDVDDDFGPTSTPIIDWTPDYSSNDRKPSSQYFTNLMTQDHDADLELLMQPDPAPTSVGKGSSKRGSNNSHDEDIRLCYSWMNISNDLIIRTDQPGKTYWERIARDFHQNINFKRTTNSLEHRCGIIIKECMKFQGYFEEV